MVLHSKSLFLLKFNKITRSVTSFSVPQEMCAWEINKYGSPLTITRTRRPPAITHPNDLLIRIDAASINPIDNYLLRGYGSSSFQVVRSVMSSKYSQEFPLTPGRDFSGVVVDSGPNVSSNFPPGTAIMGATLPYTSTQGSGSLAEYITCDACLVAQRPDTVTPVMAAALSYAGLTAWSALQTGGIDPQKRLKHSRRVLVTAGSGAVGAVAAQLARLAGASHVTITCPARLKNSADSLSFIGADDIIFAPDLPPAHMKYDVIIDCVRPSLYKDSKESSPQWRHLEFQEYFPLLRNLSASTSSESRYVILNPPVLEFVDRWGFLQGLGVSFASLGYANFHTLVSGYGRCPLRWAFFKPNGKHLQLLGDWLAQGRIRMPIEKIFSFDQVPEAFQKLNSGGNNGKIVIKF